MATMTLGTPPNAYLKVIDIQEREHTRAFMIGIKFDAMVEASAMQQAHCENCSQDYLYPVQRFAQATQVSALGIDNKGARFWAERQAKRVVERKLKSAIEVVPCPACGWYQAGMCWQIRRGKQELALCVFVLCSMGTAFLGLILLNQQIEKLTAVALSVVVACIGFRLHRYWFRKYNPNRNHPGKGGVDMVKAATSCGIRKEDVDNSITRGA